MIISETTWIEVATSWYYYYFIISYCSVRIYITAWHCLDYYLIVIISYSHTHNFPIRWPEKGIAKIGFQKLSVPTYKMDAYTRSSVPKKYILKFDVLYYHTYIILSDLYQANNILFLHFQPKTLRYRGPKKCSQHRNPSWKYNRKMNLINR